MSETNVTAKATTKEDEVIKAFQKVANEIMPKIKQVNPGAPALTNPEQAMVVLMAAFLAVSKVNWEKVDPVTRVNAYSLTDLIQSAIQRCLRDSQPF